METPRKITVTIKNQPFRGIKYRGDGDGPDCRCYLEDALTDAGYPKSHTGGNGRTSINGIPYVTEHPFGSSIVREALERGEDITVTLVRN